MGRIGKQKRLLIEQANKRLLGEETKSIDAVKKINDLRSIKASPSTPATPTLAGPRGAGPILHCRCSTSIRGVRKWQREKATRESRPLRLQRKERKR